MNSTTILSVIIALASLGGAIMMRPQPTPVVAYEDTGQLFFPNFTDPSQAASLEVIGWDESAARATSFKVELKDGKWLIPSHNDYPADGTERMGKAAASFIDVKKDMYRGDRAEDHAQFGVEDPADVNAKERGQRISIKDASGTTLVDIIVGKRVDDKDGYRYVRLADQKRVYAAKLDVDISTSFTDWIEKDLLKLEQGQIVQFMSDTYSVDEAQGRVLGSDPLLVKKDAVDGAGDAWLVAEGVATPEGKELDAIKVNQALGALDRLQIVGVRQRPPAFNDQMLIQQMQAKGFFFSMKPGGGEARLYGNEGEVRAICEDGVVYNLYFGEVTYDSGLALTAGGEPEAKKPDEEAKKEANRYMLVDVYYDPTLDTKSTGEDPAGAPGAKRAQELGNRFAKWFYVISDASFKQIRKDKQEFFKDAPPGSAPATPAPKKNETKKPPKAP